MRDLHAHLGGFDCCDIPTGARSDYYDISVLSGRIVPLSERIHKSRRAGCQAGRLELVEIRT